MLSAIGVGTVLVVKDLKKKKKKKPFLLSNAASILTELFLDWKFLNKLSTIKVERNVMAGGK